VPWNLIVGEEVMGNVGPREGPKVPYDAWPYMKVSRIQPKKAYEITTLSTQEAYSFVKC
jgi:hypothetical protein